MEPMASAQAPIVPWHPENELSRADLTPGRTTTAASAAHSSVVGDGGYAKQLAHSTAATHQSPHDSEDGLAMKDDLQHVGGAIGSKQLDNHSMVKDSTEVGSELPVPDTLERCLRVAMVESAGKEAAERLFVPVDEIDRIINFKSVLRELKTLTLGQDRDLNEIANQICSVHEGISPFDGKETKTNRRRIFATLVLIQDTAAILEVLREGLYDWHLPLALDTTDRGYHRLARRNTDGSLSLVSFPQKWSPYQHEAFSRCQWQLSSPCFEMRTHVGAKIKHYPLSAHSILPIIEIDGEDRQGGFSTVSKIKLHSAHRKSMSRDQDSTSWLALKRLRFTTEEAFKAEVGPLKRLGDNENSHIIRLLTTFQYRDEYNLVFEWADGGNLFDFWHSFPKPNDPSRNHDFGKWLATQLTGLASALSTIHKCEFDPRAANISGFNSRDGRKKYGAHGDLKPENILWFKAGINEEESYDLGTFKLSDFGLASFHSLESRKRFLPAGISATYRAPECDLDKHISQKYDMWSLGCVLLEHLTWYLLGSEGVDAFGQKRLEESQSAFKEDNFFSIQDPYSLHGGGATIKRCVHDHFNVLRSLPNCSDFIADILDFVQDRLLRMFPDHRCEVAEFLVFTHDVGKKCMEDEVYCTKRIHPIKERTATTLSTLTARLSVQPGQASTFAAANRGRTNPPKPTIKPTPNGPDMRNKGTVSPVAELEATQMEQGGTKQKAVDTGRMPREDPTLNDNIKDGELKEEAPKSMTQRKPDSTNEQQLLTVPGSQHVHPSGSHDKTIMEESRKVSCEDISGASNDGNSLKVGTIVQKRTQQDPVDFMADSGCFGGFMRMIKVKIRYPRTRGGKTNA